MSRRTTQDRLQYDETVRKAVASDLQDTIKDSLSYYLTDPQLTAQVTAKLSNVIMNRYEVLWTNQDYTLPVSLMELNILFTAEELEQSQKY